MMIDRRLFFFRQQLCQLFQPVQRFFQCALLPRKMQTDQVVDRFSEKAGARHGRNADGSDHPFTKLQIGVFLKLWQVEKRLNIQHHKIGALRNIVLQTDPVESGTKEIALLRIERPQVFIIAVRQRQTGNGCLLQRRIPL